ncbi:MAG: hypothetical protein RhofKO_17350 [Rhodothermales bacterium]
MTNKPALSNPSHKQTAEAGRVDGSASTKPGGTSKSSSHREGTVRASNTVRLQSEYDTLTKPQAYVSYVYSDDKGEERRRAFSMAEYRLAPKPPMMYDNRMDDEEFEAYLEDLIRSPCWGNDIVETEAILRAYRERGAVPKWYRAFMEQCLKGERFNAFLGELKRREQDVLRRELIAEIARVDAGGLSADAKLDLFNGRMREAVADRDALRVHLLDGAIERALESGIPAWTQAGFSVERELIAMLRRDQRLEDEERQELIKSYHALKHEYLDGEPSPTLRMLGQLIALAHIEVDILKRRHYRTHMGAKGSSIDRQVQSAVSRLQSLLGQYERFLDMTEKRWAKHRGGPRRSSG